ncbi:MAG: hypothetical protein N3D85_04065 [Candidatus Bathyarchaeota archaeon]|nr:hypothetical protein [Candidatus Bathyarchaeota archaeon]
MTNQKSNSQTGFFKIYSINEPLSLPIQPCYSNGSYRITKIVLQKATLWFDSKSDSAISENFQVDQNAFLFMINGTIRNNYTPEEIITSSLQGVNYCTVGLDVRLYDTQGTFVNTLTRGTPLHGFELKLKSGEETYFEVPFVTSTRDVAYFEICIIYLEPLRLY